MGDTSPDLHSSHMAWEQGQGRCGFIAIIWLLVCEVGTCWVVLASLCRSTYRVLGVWHGIEWSHSKRILVQYVKVCVILRKIVSKLENNS